MTSSFADTDQPGELPPDANASLRHMVTRHPGRRLPSERDLAARLSVSRVRLRSLLQKLSDEGLIESRRGSGTYVIDQNACLCSVALLVDRQIKLGDDPFFSRLIDLLQTALQHQSIRCMIERTDGQNPSPRSEACDGIVTIGQFAASFSGDARRAVPAVALMPGKDMRSTRRISVFALRDYDAGRDAARLLIAQGCRTIVFAGRRGVDASENRFQGAASAANDAGVPIEPRETSLNYLGGLRLAEAQTLAPSDQIGFIAMNDWLAVGLRAGLGATSDVSERVPPIVSFDGLPITSEPSLQITSLAVPLEEIASDAVAEIQRLSPPRGVSGRMVSYDLNVREFSEGLSRL